MLARIPEDLSQGFHQDVQQDAHQDVLTLSLYIYATRAIAMFNAAVLLIVTTVTIALSQIHLSQASSLPTAGGHTLHTYVCVCVLVYMCICI